MIKKNKNNNWNNRRKFSDNMFVQFRSKIKTVVQPKEDQHARRFKRKTTSTSLEHSKEATRVPNVTYIAHLSVFFKASWFRIFESSLVPQLFSRQMKKSTLLWCWAHFNTEYLLCCRAHFKSEHLKKLSAGPILKISKLKNPTPVLREANLWVKKTARRSHVQVKTSKKSQWRTQFWKFRSRRVVSRRGEKQICKSQWQKLSSTTNRLSNMPAN